MWNTGLDEAQARIKIARRNINNLRYADDTTLMAESKEELKSLFMKVKEEREKELADGDCSHEIKRHLLLGRKAMTSLDNTLKSEPLLCQQRSI